MEPTRKTIQIATPFTKGSSRRVNVDLIKVRRQTENSIKMVMQTCQDGFVHCSIYRSTLEKQYWPVFSARDTGSQTRDPVGAYQHSITSFGKKKKKRGGGVKRSFRYGFTLATQTIDFNPQHTGFKYLQLTNIVWSGWTGLILIQKTKTEELLWTTELWEREAVMFTVDVGTHRRAEQVNSSASISN